MGLAAIFLALSLAHLAQARAPLFVQEAGSSSTQNTPTNQTQPGAADQKQNESKPDQPPAPEEAQTPSAQKSTATHPTAARKRRSRKSSGADGSPDKIVIHQGGTSDPIAQILPGIPEEEANRKRQSTEQLLAAAESSLKELGARTLKPNQQDLIAQIRQYMDGARSALKESDIQRAHTLALKAYLLSDDLLKH